MKYKLRDDARIYEYEGNWWIGLPAEDGTYWGHAIIVHQDVAVPPLFEPVELGEVGL